MKIPFVDLSAQYLSLKNEIDEAIASVIRETAFVGGFGNRFVKVFEEKFAEYLGISHCISCANGTDSLEILLKCFGVGPGDEVVVPSLSWISTSESVSNIGAVPVFADIDERTFTVSPSEMEKKISAKTKAVIPVHLYGHPADMDPILEIAKKNNLAVIEDCAQSHGAVYKGRITGTMGNAGSFSFFPGKNLGAYGDAGGMVSGSSQTAETARMIANHGQVKKHDHRMEGRNSRMDGIQAAVLNVKLKYLKEATQKRIYAAQLYRKYINSSRIVHPQVSDRCTHVYHLYVIRSKSRDEIIKRLAEKDIASAVQYPLPLPLLPAYSRFGFKEKDFPVAAEICKEIVSLPIYPEITEEQIAAVSRIVNSI